MMNKRLADGFTVVELVVVITIAVILLGLTSLAVTGSIYRGRDAERKSDTQNITTFLDSAYSSGYQKFPLLKGSYPSTAHMSTADGIKDVFAGFSLDNLRSPELTGTTLSLVMATNSNQSTSGVTPQPTGTTYVYQPLASDDTLCSSTIQECRKFNLYYTNETEKSIQKVMSKYR